MLNIGGLDSSVLERPMVHLTPPLFAVYIHVIYDALFYGVYLNHLPFATVDSTHTSSSLHPTHTARSDKNKGKEYGTAPVPLPWRNPTHVSLSISLSLSLRQPNHRRTPSPPSLSLIHLHALSRPIIATSK